LQFPTKDLEILPLILNLHVFPKFGFSIACEIRKSDTSEEHDLETDPNFRTECGLKFCGTCAENWPKTKVLGATGENFLGI
jgi:hypothetical protein